MLKSIDQFVVRIHNVLYDVTYCHCDIPNGNLLNTLFGIYSIKHQIYICSTCYYFFNVLNGSCNSLATDLFQF